jgi:hypothetical protein
MCVCARDYIRLWKLLETDRVLDIYIYVYLAYEDDPRASKHDALINTSTLLCLFVCFWLS